MNNLTPDVGEFAFESEGVKMVDTPKGIFMKNDMVLIGFFIRRSFIHTAPMAMTGDGQVYIVIDADIKVFLKKSTHLTLKDKENNVIKMKIPLDWVMPMFAESAGEFMAWAKHISPIINPPSLNFLTIPKYFFDRSPNV